MQAPVLDDPRYECVAYIAGPAPGSVGGPSSAIPPLDQGCVSRPQLRLLHAPSLAEARDRDVLQRALGADSAGVGVSVFAEDLRHIHALSVHVTIRHPGFTWKYRDASLWALRKPSIVVSASVGAASGPMLLLCLLGALETVASVSRQDSHSIGTEAAARMDACDAAIIAPLPASYDFALNEPGSFTVSSANSEPLVYSSVHLCRVKYGSSVAVGGKGFDSSSKAAFAEETKRDDGLAARLCRELNSLSCDSATTTGKAGVGEEGTRDVVIGVRCRACGSALAAQSGHISSAMELPSGQFDLTLHEFMCCEDPVGPMASGEVRARPGVVALGFDCALVSACDAALSSLSISVGPSDGDAPGEGRDLTVRLSEVAKQQQQSLPAEGAMAELFCSTCHASIGDIYLPPAAFSGADAAVSAAPASQVAVDPLSSYKECHPCSHIFTNIASGRPPINSPELSILSADLRFKLHRVLFEAVGNLIGIDAEQEVCAALLQTCDAIGAHRVRFRRKHSLQPSELVNSGALGAAPLTSTADAADAGTTGNTDGVLSIEVKVLSRDISVAYSEALTFPVRPPAEPLPHWSSMRLAARIAFRTEASSASSEASGPMPVPELSLAPDVFDEVYILLTHRAALLPPLGAWRSAFLLR